MVRTCPVTAEYKKSTAAEFDLYQKYQMAIHHDSESELSISGYTRFLVSSPFQVRADCLQLA